MGILVLYPPFNVGPSIRIFNIGNSKPVDLKKYLKFIEYFIGKKAKINKLPLQLGDIKNTLSNTKLLKKVIGRKKNTSVKEGVQKFINWYKSFYKVK